MIGPDIVEHIWVGLAGSNRRRRRLASLELLCGHGWNLQSMRGDQDENDGEMEKKLSKKYRLYEKRAATKTKPRGAG